VSLFKSDKNSINTTKEKRFILNLFGKQLVDIMKHYKVVLGGGALTSLFTRTNIKDFDLFVSDEATYHAVCKDIGSLSYLVVKDVFDSDKVTKIPKVDILFESDNAKSFKVQVDKSLDMKRILSGYGVGFSIELNDNSIQLQVVNPQLSRSFEIFDKFDFSVCKATFDFESEEFDLDPSFLVDISRKELHYNPQCSCPWGAVFRLHKYLKKGFTVSSSELLKIILSVRDVKMNTLEDFLNSLIVVNDYDLKSHLESIISEKDLTETIDIESIFEWIEDYNINGKYVPSKYDVKNKEVYHDII
jgi:hypothetical protein